MGRQKRYAIGGWSKQNQRLWEGRNGTQLDDGLSETIGYGKEKKYAIGGWSKQNHRLWESRNGTQLEAGLSKTKGYGKAETRFDRMMV